MSTSLAAAAQTNHAEAASWAAETLASLSLEEKVAQMICEQMRGEYTADDSEAFLYWSRLARDYGIGGFVVYGGTPRDTAHLLNRLQKLAKIPLLISGTRKSSTASAPSAPAFSRYAPGTTCSSNRKTPSR